MLRVTRALATAFAHVNPRSLALAAGIVLLIAGHGLILSYVSAHLALSAAAMSGLIAVVAIRHLGLARSLFARFGRHSRRS